MAEPSLQTDVRTMDEAIDVTKALLAGANRLLQAKNLTSDWREVFDSQRSLLAGLLHFLRVEAE